jgi:hypothetical protein
MAIAAAIAVVISARSLERALQRRWPRLQLSRALMLSALLITLPPVTAQVHAARHGDARLEALDWVNANLPPGAKILREWNMIHPSRGLYDVNTDETLLVTSGRTLKEIANQYDFVIASSAAYDWIFRQRSRPGFKERAAFYTEMFDSSRFELLSQFEPWLFAFGPEIRIYRTLPLRGARISANRPSIEPKGGHVWGNSRDLRAQKGKGRYTFQRRWNLVAGAVVLKRPARLELSGTLETDSSFPLEISLGTARCLLRVAGNGDFRLVADLPAGQSWWKVASGPDFERGDVGEVSGITITRLEALDP